MAIARVLEEDPGLAESLTANDLVKAKEAAIARVDGYAEGVWREAEHLDRLRDGYGLLVLDGVLARRVQLERFECTELLGQGDLLRPWSFDGAGAASIPAGITWHVVDQLRVAVLDKRFAMSIAPWPAVAAALMDRIVERARWLAYQLAVCQLVRVDTRILVTFWHFADRWGRMTADGVILHMPVTHSMLAGIVGSRRPSVTTALGRLERDGSIRRLGDGRWLLRGEPPSDFGRLHERSRPHLGQDRDAA